MTTAAALRLLTFYNVDIYHAADNPGGLDGKDGMATNYLAVAADVGQVGKEVAEATGSVGLGARYTFDVGTSDTDPGAGKLRLNHASAGSATYLYASTTDVAGVSVAALLDAMDDSTSSVKALLILRHQTDPGKWAVYTLTGALVSAGGYRKLPLTYIAGPGGFAAADSVSLGFVRVGDKGDTGSGTNASQLNGATDSTSATANTIAKRDSGGNLYAVDVEAAGATPRMRMRETDAGTDGQRWDVLVEGGVQSFRVVNDAYTAANSWLAITRSGVTVSSVDFKVLPSINGTSFMTVGGGDFTGAVRARTPYALTDGATVTPNFALSNDWTLTLGGNRTLANPTNMFPPQGGSIFITQDATGGRTLAFGSYWKFPSGAAPTLTTTAGRTDRLDYVVKSTTEIHAQLTKDVR